MIRHLAVVGATGAVGREMCALIAQRGIRAERISLFASERGAGTKINVNGTELRVAELSAEAFGAVDYALFSAGGHRSREFVPIAARAGAVAIDNSSIFRLDDDVPLVIPEINPQDARGHRGIIANPNCSTIIMNLVVWPLHRVNPVQRIVVSTYQAASGAGAAAMDELRSQTADVLAGRPATPRVFPYQIAFNLFAHDSPVGRDGYNAEERKMIDETRKIFHEPQLAVSATCVRVPVMRAHSESVNVTFARPISPGEVRDILHSAPGVEVIDDVDAGRFPMPLDAAGRDNCLVGRIRADLSQPEGRGIDMFVCGDQLRKGAALNALQILELVSAR